MIEAMAIRKCGLKVRWLVAAVLAAVGASSGASPEGDSLGAVDPLLGFVLTRQPAIWMGEWGAVRILLQKPLAIESVDAHPHCAWRSCQGRRACLCDEGEKTR